VQQSADDVALSTLEQVEAIAAFYRHEWAYAREAISRAEERGNRTAHPEAWFASLIRVSLLRCVGRPMDALRSIDREIRIADERQQAFALLHLQLVRANILLDLGRLDEAEIQADAVRDLAEDIGAVWTIDVGAASILAQIAVHKDSPDVTDKLGPLVSLFTKDEVAHQRRGGEWIEMIFADLAGDSQTIEARTRGDYDRSRILGPPVGGASDTLDDVYFTRLVLGVGVPERARQVVSLARDRAQITGAPIANAVLDHVVGLVEGVPRLLVSAAETYHRLDRPLAESAAWEDLADMVRTAEPAEAVQALRRAHALLSECDATRSLARVEGRLRELGERPPARTSTRNALGLTAAEQRIVDRAVRNETATEIAAALYLSRNTVTAHLRRIYAKLGVRSREQMTEVVRLRGGVSR
jgi:DNA-binding CsgD family transcriptional regulator